MPLKVGDLVKLNCGVGVVVRVPAPDSFVMVRGLARGDEKRQEGQLSWHWHEHVEVLRC